MAANARKALMETAYEMNDVAYDLSSGSYSLAQLAAMGHPYSKRHGGVGVPYGDPAVINKQSGKFRSGWQVEYRANPGGIPTANIVNTDPKAEEVTGGEGRMIKRPIVERIKERTRPGYIARMAKAISEAIR